MKELSLTEWITEADLSIKEFAEEFANVVKENFGQHNYKIVTNIINSKLQQQSEVKRDPSHKPKQSPESEKH